MIRLAVLDMAGTTVTDGGAVEAAFFEALAEVGVSEDDPALVHYLERVQATMGMSKIVVFRHLFEGAELAHRANAAFENAYSRRVGTGQVTAIPGAEESIVRLRRQGVRVCLVTGFSPATQTALIDHLGWADLVDLALAPGKTCRGRPHPDLVLTALMALQLDDVREVAVAGDTVNDLVAGHRAGATVVAGVLSGAHDRDQLAAAPHTHLLESVTDLPSVLEER
ncbi:phosphonatase-like hydrolase [soil metagenome]